MKPIISQTEAAFLGFSRGVHFAALACTFLLIIAHYLNPAIGWLYPGVTLGVSLAAALLYSSKVTAIRKRMAEERSSK